MARLLGREKIGHRESLWWLHTDQFGRDQITVETREDAEPVIEQVKSMAEVRYKDLSFKASIPQTIVDECCKVYAKAWNMRPSLVMAELVKNKTSRAKRVWKILTEGRDYRKLQAKSWR